MLVEKAALAISGKNPTPTKELSFRGWPGSVVVYELVDIWLVK
jgi:hypothetical protein